MKQYNKPTDNMGGLLNIWAIPVSDIVSVEANKLTLVSDTNTIMLPIQDESAVLITSSELTESGMIHQTEISAVLVAENSQLQSLLSQLVLNRFAVLVQTANGNFILSGSKTEYLVPKYMQKTGRLSADLNSYSITFSAKLTKPQLEVQNPFYTVATNGGIGAWAVEVNFVIS